MTSPASTNQNVSARPRLVLVFAAFLGLLMAGVPLVRPTSNGSLAMPADAVASVNGVPIEDAEYRRALDAVASDTRDPLTEEDRAQVLSRLIDQELLVQRALDLGFDQRDRTVRNTLVTAMVQMILAEAESEEISDEAVKTFYAEHGERFARTGRVRVREIRVPVNAERNEEVALERAEEAVARLRLGESFETVAAELGARPIAPIPGGLLPPSQLRTYLGPTPAAAALALQPGHVSDPVRGGSAYHVLVMVEREPGAQPPLSEVEGEVRTEMRRRAGDDAIRRYLDRLADEADVRRASP